MVDIAAMKITRNDVTFRQKIGIAPVTPELVIAGEIVDLFKRLAPHIRGAVKTFVLRRDRNGKVYGGLEPKMAKGQKLAEIGSLGVDETNQEAQKIMAALKQYVGRSADSYLRVDFG